MSYLIDTDILSAFTKKTLPAKLADWLRRNDGDCFVSIVSIGEMRFGLPGIGSENYAALAERISQTELRFITAFEPVDIDTIVEWKRLLSRLKTVNRTMTCEDSLIAATAIQRGHILATLNSRHFAPAVQFGLKLEDPSN